MSRWRLPPRGVFGQLVLVIALVLLGAALLAAVLGRELAVGPASGQLLRAMQAFAAVAERLERSGSRETLVTALREAGLQVRREPPAPPAGRVAPLMRALQARAAAQTGPSAPAREIRIGRGSAGDGNVAWLRLGTSEPLWVSFTDERRGEHARRFSVALLLGCALLVWVAAAWCARRLVQPLRRLARQAPAVVRGEGSEALGGRAPREVDELARAMVDAGTAMRAASDERNVMLAGISHDLRTPLTRVQFALELLPEVDPELRAGIDRDIAEIDAILSQFIAYARDGRDEAVEPVDLAEICRNVVGASDVAWELQVPDRALARGRPMALLRAVENLVVNAQRHGAPPYSLALAREQDHWRIEIGDHGPGLGRHEARRLLQPFAHGAGGGSGLGLAIAERVARQHHGELRLLPNPPRGLRAVLVVRGH
ncbi:ATP-binding protein [Luteimonas sp. RD2P54]|uniref:histidine kinase n=1 Tax=Luteimonas endophytica TaxID=3042023 RepID=A0ABT6J7G9_9GAMM|nr:ATP-binding protein [Luteimonas endophytica]MDH5822545.1 ATP-binding protein [Luteimonas endophytica]